MAIISSMNMIYSTMEGIVPSRCRLTTRHLGATRYCSNLHHHIYKVPAHYYIMTRHLGATLFKLGLHQVHKSHVTASMHHDTWGLMQSHCLLTYWRPDSSHRNESALGGCQLLLSTIQGTQIFIYYWRIHCSVRKAQSSQHCWCGFKPHDGGYIIWCYFH